MTVLQGQNIKRVNFNNLDLSKEESLFEKKIVVPEKEIEKEKPIDLEHLKSKELPEDIITKIENIKSNDKKDDEVTVTENV